jgi:uncharacterized membrane protein YhaH (DUF805 family)
MGLLGFYFLPSGRISRGSFWLGILGLLLIEAAFSIWIGMTLFSHDVLDPNAAPLAKPAMQLELLIDLIFLFPTFVVLARRFHDRNKGAIWSVPFLAAHLAVVVAAVVGIMPTEIPKITDTISMPAVAISLGWLVVFIWILIELGCLKGTSGTNRFGADPLAR